MVPLTFELPADLAATAPPEARGLARDEVRLMVSTPDGVRHTSVRQLPDALHPGDVVVVNTSATLPAAVDGSRQDGRDVTVHFANPATHGAWLVELRRPDGSGPTGDARVGERVRLPGGVDLEIADTDRRFARALLLVESRVEAYLARYGRPIT